MSTGREYEGSPGQGKIPPSSGGKDETVLIDVAVTVGILGKRLGRGKELVPRPWRIDTRRVEEIGSIEEDPGIRLIRHPMNGIHVWIELVPDEGNDIVRFDIWIRRVGNILVERNGKPAILVRPLSRRIDDIVSAGTGCIGQLLRSYFLVRHLIDSKLDSRFLPESRRQYLDHVVSVGTLEYQRIDNGTVEPSGLRRFIGTTGKCDHAR